MGNKDQEYSSGLRIGVVCLGDDRPVFFFGFVDFFGLKMDQSKMAIFYKSKKMAYCTFSFLKMAAVHFGASFKKMAASVFIKSMRV
jgi:hypothetical protein